MKTGIFSFLGLSLAVVSLSGCTDLSSPQATLGTAHRALIAGDLKAFRDTLNDPALETIGKPEAFAALRAEVAGLKFSLGTPRLLASRTDLRGWTSYRFFEVEVTGKTLPPGAGRPGSLARGEASVSRRYVARIGCDVSYYYRERWISESPYGGHYPMPGYPFPGHPGPDYDCSLRDGHLGYCHFEETSICLIAELKSL